MYQKTLVENIKPYRSFGFLTVIPPNTNTFTQSFPYSVNLSDSDYNYVSRMVVNFDTSGLYNVPVQEVFNLNGSPVTVDPGYYTLTQLQTLANVTVPLTGAFAFRTLNAQPLQFFANSKLVEIFGYQSFGTSLIPASTRSPDVFDQTSGLSILAISSTLNTTATGFGTNYLTVVPVISPSPGFVITDEKRMEVPIISNMFQTIQWILYGANGIPFVINTPITIFTEISCIRKTY